MKTAVKESNVEEVATTAAALALEEAERKRKKEDKAKRSRKRATRNNSRNVPVLPLFSKLEFRIVLLTF